MSLLVVTLTMFTYLDSDELVAFNKIKSLSTTQTMQVKIKNYINKIILSRIKYKFKRVDLDCITDKYYGALEKVECSLELHRQQKTKNIHDEFISNIREVSEKNLESLFKGFSGMWEFEDLLEEYLIANDEMCKQCQESKNTMIRCLNLARCLVTIGSVKNIQTINEIQHKKAISTKELKKAKSTYLTEAKYKLKKNLVSYVSHECDFKDNINNFTAIQKSNNKSNNEFFSEYSSQQNDIMFQDLAESFNQDALDNNNLDDDKDSSDITSSL